MQYIQGTTAQSQPMKIKENTDICNITFYQRTFLGTLANQKRHDLKSYNTFCYWSVVYLVGMHYIQITNIIQNQFES